MRCIINIPFADAPKELIEQLNSCDFTYYDYRSCCPLYDELPVYWNFAVVEDDQIIAFVWGILEPLERFLHVVRCSILPEYRRSEVNFLAHVSDFIREAAIEMGAVRAFYITDRPEIYLDKIPSKAILSNSKVVEVSFYENLH